MPLAVKVPVFHQGEKKPLKIKVVMLTCFFIPHIELKLKKYKYIKIISYKKRVQYDNNVASAQMDDRTVI